MAGDNAKERRAAEAGAALMDSLTHVRTLLAARVDSLRDVGAMLTRRARRLREECAQAIAGEAEIAQRVEELARREAELAARVADLEARERDLSRGGPSVPAAITPSEAFARILDHWLEEGNADREVTTSELHRECAATAAARGMDASCLGHARSFGLRLRRYLAELKNAVAVHRRQGAHRRAVMSFRRNP